ncbi:MAG: hypothetical protein WD768_03535 [Phycisphaeraceae bacterium]
MTQPDEKQGDDKVRQYAEAVAQALINGRPPSEILAEMERQGWKTADAEEFLSKIRKATWEAERARDLRKSLGRNLLIHAVLGAIWVVLGVLAFVASNSQRDMRGIGIAIGTFGLFEFGWSLVNWKRTPK